MRKIPFKNYIYYVLLIIVTILLTLFLSNSYLDKKKKESEFYNYSNKITWKELDEFIIENPDAILYIGNKYDNGNKDFEKQLEEKIEELNIKEKIVFINFNNKLSNKLNLKYKLNINANKLPVIVFFNEKLIKSYYYVSDLYSIDYLINKEEIKW